ncbi:DUF1205 domain-containing protein [Streptomyces sp. FXJ1.4098]|uniref:nucleotide disphospho-sugar-binding domain-containing protein n=1 Tax=Streptomyces sp. NPDC020845 TaxID=3365096 RepID=UPI002993D0E0|nr:DUF1205 domain-containing protein [Streptomyces sp. FXJ1.4098]
MRVLFVVSNWPGHWFSMVPLGWALQAAGHDVRVVCAPSQAEPVGRAGLTPLAVLDAPDLAFMARLLNYSAAQGGRWPYRELPPHPVTGHPVASLDEFEPGAWLRDHHEQLIDMARRSTDAAVAFGRWWRPQLVVHDLLSLEGPLVGRVLAVPALLHLWGPVGPDDRVRGVPLVPLDTSRAFQRYEVGALRRETYEYAIDPCPAGAAPPLTAHRIPVRHVPYNGPGAMPPWLQALPESGASFGRPRVCVVWGTSVSVTFGPGSFAVPKVVEALAELDVEVLLTVTGADRERIGTLPPGVRLLEHTPLHLLLPSCDLVVHHAGGGCAMTGLAAGVPHLMLPCGLDQETIADRIVAAGAGIALPNATADVPAIRAAARALLGDPSYRATALRLQEEMAAGPHPSALVSRLEELAAGALLVRG